MLLVIPAREKKGGGGIRKGNPTILELLPESESESELIMFYSSCRLSSSHKRMGEGGAGIGKSPADPARRAK